MKRIFVSLFIVTALIITLLAGSSMAEGISESMESYDITAEDIMFLANIFKQMNEGNDNGLREGEDYYPMELKLAKLGADMGSGELALWVGEIYQGGHVEGLSESEAVTEAIAWWESAVELGQPRGLTNIGLLYAHNNIPGGGANFGDIEQDDAMALDYLIRACDAGDLKAPRYIAQFYENGRGSEQDYSKALEYYLKAAALGDITANECAGRYYLEGKGTDVDYEKALEYLTAAASSEKVVPGVAQARYLLGTMYEQGLGMEADPEEALKWYQSSAEAGYEDAAAAVERLQ